MGLLVSRLYLQLMIVTQGLYLLPFIEQEQGITIPFLKKGKNHLFLEGWLKRIGAIEFDD